MPGGGFIDMFLIFTLIPGEMISFDSYLSYGLKARN